MRLAKMLQARPQTTRATEPFAVAPTFLGFLDQIGVTPRPGQAEFARVAFDGALPVDRALAASIFGPIDFEALPVGTRDVVAGVCGGRGGKSYLLVALRMVWGMLVRDLSSLAPGQRAVALVVAPNEGLRQEVVNYALGAMRSRPDLAALLRLPRGTRPDDVVEEFEVQRPDGHFVTFKGGVATAGGYGGRGKSLTDFAMDEAAFFRDKASKVNDDDIFKAASPRVLPGGQTLVMSTPWAEGGLLYELYARNWGKPTDALAAHAPTTTLNDLEWVKRIVEREYRRDPENAEREFGAKFMLGGTSIFFAPTLIEACVDETLDVDVPRMPKPGDAVAVGADLGFISDSAAAAITHLSAGSLILAELLEAQPKAGAPLKPKAVLGEFKARMAAHGSTTMMGDGHYIATAQEELGESGLTYVQAPAQPHEVYVRARQKMREGIVRIPRNERLIRQLKEVQGRPRPGGGMSIIQPRWAKGGHGDLCSAFVLGLWQLVTENVPALKPDVGTKEWEAEQREFRRLRRVEEIDKPAWMPTGTAPADRGQGAWWKR